jgi:hypothetical protein
VQWTIRERKQDMEHGRRQWSAHRAIILPLR